MKLIRSDGSFSDAILTQETDACVFNGVDGKLRKLTKIILVD